MAVQRLPNLHAQVLALHPRDRSRGTHNDEIENHLDLTFRYCNRNPGRSLLPTRSQETNEQFSTHHPCVH